MTVVVSIEPYLTTVASRLGKVTLEKRDWPARVVVSEVGHPTLVLRFATEAQLHDVVSAMTTGLPEHFTLNTQLGFGVERL